MRRKKTNTNIFIYSLIIALKDLVSLQLGKKHNLRIGLINNFQGVCHPRNQIVPSTVTSCMRWGD